MREMTQEEALRIIRNVAEHNTHDVPMPAQVAAAVGQVTAESNERMRLVGQMLEVYSAVAAVGEMIKKQVYHRHPVDGKEAAEALVEIYEQMYLLETLWIQASDPAPKTLLGQEV